MTQIQIDLGLRFKRHHTDPDITVSLNNDVLLAGKQSHDQCCVRFSRGLEMGPQRLSVVFHNMQKSCPTDPEMAVLIDSLRFQTLDYDFTQFGQYRPDYPQPWYQEQQALGIKPMDVIYTHYLGWNGIWYLDFEVPIYTWIHRRLQLGWLI